MNLLGVAAQEIYEEPPEIVRFDDGMIGPTIEARPGTYNGHAWRVWAVQVSQDGWRYLLKRESIN